MNELLHPLRTLGVICRAPCADTGASQASMSHPLNAPPKECPVCKSTALQQSSRQNAFARVPAQPPEDFSIQMSYRCENGHVFVWRQPGS